VQVPTHGDGPSRHSEKVLASIENLTSVPYDCPAVVSGRIPGQQGVSSGISGGITGGGLDGIDESYSLLWGRHILPRSTRSLFGIDKAYIVHYTPLKKRRSTMIERMKNVFGEDCFEANFASFIDAFDRENMTKKDISILTGDRVFTKLSAGVLSVAAKHYHAYYDALYHGYEVIIILEDDVEFNDFFSKKVSQVICALPTDGSKWANVFLATPFPHIKCEPVNQAVCIQDGGSNGAVAYLMSISGCRTMVESLPTQAASDIRMAQVGVEQGGAFVTYGTNYNLAREDRVDALSSHNSFPFDYKK